MPNRTLLMAVAVGCTLAAACGCEPVKFGAAPKPPAVMPTHVAGTVGQYARLVDGGQLSVKGYCVVVGLGKDGSAEVPRQLGKYITQYLLKLNLGSFRAHTSSLTPARFLRDLDTAIVDVRGVVPSGAPAGTRFDVLVTAAPQTQTRSLDGGTLMPTELRLALGGMEFAGKGSMMLAEAGGAIFVNPFLDMSRPTDLLRARIGRVIGGGRLLKDRPLRLSLRQPDFAICRLIERRINEQFPAKKRVAVGKSSSVIELHIPPDRRDDYEQFLKLVMHLPVRSGPGVWEAHARRIVEGMARPGANHDELALVWEAMGRQVIPTIQPLYSSRNKATAFYTARTGMRLGDDIAADVVIRFASEGDSPLQIQAVRELGRHPRVARAALALRQLVDDQDELVRIAAYEALLKRGDRTVVTRVDVTDEFKLDIVNSSRRNEIYAWHGGEQRIVLFGREMTVHRDVFFNAPQDMVTVNANKGDKRLTLYRRIPRTGDFSENLFTDFSVRSLITTLGSLPERGPDGKIEGLGLTYSQVVGVLYRMCQANNIQAKFRLQTLSGLQRLYSDTLSIGRRDMPVD